MFGLPCKINVRLNSDAPNAPLPFLPYVNINPDDWQELQGVNPDDWQLQRTTVPYAITTPYNTTAQYYVTVSDDTTANVNDKNYYII